MPEANEKPIRVLTGQVSVFTCPLCGKDVHATVEVEVRLGDLAIERDGESNTDFKVVPNVEAQSRLRRLVVEHDCNAGAIASLPVPEDTPDE